MTFRAELRALVRLTTPIALANLGQQTMGLVDTAMVGRYSEEALAGTGIAAVMMLAVTVLATGAVLGLDTLIPQALGAGERERADRMYRAGLRVAVLVGLPVMLLTAATPALFTVLDVAPAAAEEGTVYLYARLPSILPLLVLTAGRSYLQARGITRPIVIAMIAGNAVNVVANFVLIFGDDGLTGLGLPALGLPALGSLGAGLATLFVWVAQMLIIVTAVARVRQPPARHPDDERAIVRDTLRIGLPIGLQLGAEVGAFALMGLLAGRLGVLPAAAHQVALLLGSVPFNIALAIGSASAVRVGHAVGAGDTAGPARAGAAAMVLTAAVMGTSALLFLSFPAVFARLVTDDVDVIASAVVLLQIAAVWQLSDGAQAAGAGALRGAGDTRAAFVGNAIGHYLIGVPLSIWLGFSLGLGAAGLWWGMAAGLTAVAAGLWSRFFWIARGGITRA